MKKKLKTLTWNEDRTPWRAELLLDAKSYKVDLLFDVGVSNAHGDGPYLVSPAGSLAYRNRILPKGNPLSLFPDGLVSWNGTVVIPILIDMTLRANDGQPMTGCSEEFRAKWGSVWMSLTPAEMLSQRPGIRRAAGNVVVGGLGMGWFLRKVCERPEVESVIVVEKRQDLLAWYGYDLCERHSKVTDVVCGDVYDHVGKHGNAMYLLDIWPTYAGIQHDQNFWEAKRQLADRLWGWGEDAGRWRSRERGPTVGGRVAARRPRSFSA